MRAFKNLIKKLWHFKKKKEKHDYSIYPMF